MTCEDFPCCGHEPGCCPDFDASGHQLNKRCTCGATVPATSPYSLCNACLGFVGSQIRIVRKERE